jgi:hypothetical protein
MNHTLVRLAGIVLLGAIAVACRSRDSLAPQCVVPVPLLGQANSAAPGFIVVFHDQVDAQAETQRLASRYGFTPTHVYTAALTGFSAQLSPALVEQLRCEASVSYVEFNSLASAV